MTSTMVRMALTAKTVRTVLTVRTEQMVKTVLTVTLRFSEQSRTLTVLTTGLSTVSGCLTARATRFLS